MPARRLRLLILLVLLALAGGVTAYDRYAVRGWRAPLPVEIRPIVGDAVPQTRAYVAQLAATDFSGIDRFLTREAQRHGFDLPHATRLTLLEPGEAVPPPPPQVASLAANVWWSLAMRWWSYRDAGRWLPSVGVVKLYVVYRAPADDLNLPHSLGLQKGLIGVVHARAGAGHAAHNDLVMTHELLHTLGATDKYLPGSNQPVFPDGYAEPERQPRHPQTAAEIMAGRIAVSEAHAVSANGLARARIGAKTAREIGFNEAFNRYWESRR